MYNRSIPHASILRQLSADVVRKIWQLKGPVILGHGLTQSHGEREKAPHRESAPGKFPAVTASLFAASASISWLLRINLLLKSLLPSTGV